jgi:hypothetical protein
MKSLQLLELEAKFALLNTFDPDWIEKLIAKTEEDQKIQDQLPKRKIIPIEDNKIDM